MNLDEIKTLIELIDDSSLSKLTIEQEDFLIKIEKAGASAPAVATVAPTAPVTPVVAAPAAAPAPEAPAAVEAGEYITSPMVGTFYKSPSPDSPAFVKVGDKVTKGKTICMLEAMKIFNEVEAEFDCTILEVLATDGQVVEYDTPLFKIKRS